MLQLAGSLGKHVRIAGTPAYFTRFSRSSYRCSALRLAAQSCSYSLWCPYSWLPPVAAAALPATLLTTPLATPPAVLWPTPPGIPRRTRSPDKSIEGLPDQFQRMVEVWELLNREHVSRGNLDSQALSDGAIRGMLQALDDPYAAFLTPDQFSLESQDIQGFFEGIGAEVGLRDGRFTILAPIPDTPAEKAGIRPWRHHSGDRG